MFFKILFDILIYVIINKWRYIVKSVITNDKLEKKDILKTFYNAYKTKAEYKIGIEYERLPIKNNNYSSVDFFENKGICNFLRRFAEEYQWDYILDGSSLIGLKNGHDTITLEPGCQLEFSLEPERLISSLKSKIDKYNFLMSELLDEYEFSLIEYGISPLTTYKNINLLPKKRYEIMAGYLWGILSDVMMRETAGIQICIDYCSEEDAMKKFRIANMMCPFVTAMFANSPIRGGVDTGYKSFRALAWLNTDSDRCGFSTKFQKDFGFDDYINTVLNVPMIFFQRGDEFIKINSRLKFKDYLNDGYEGYNPTMDDFNLHSNLYFPDVRLRNFIEIRNHDCVNKNMLYSLIAFYKGIFYSNDALTYVDELLSRFTYNEILELRYQIPQCGLEGLIQNIPLKDIAIELMSIAHSSLLKQNQVEEKYLEPIQEFLFDGVTPADVILLNWNGIWNKNISKLVRYLKSV